MQTEQPELVKRCSVCGAEEPPLWFEEPMNETIREYARSYVLPVKQYHLICPIWHNPCIGWPMRLYARIMPSYGDSIVMILILIGTPHRVDHSNAKHSALSFAQCASMFHVEPIVGDYSSWAGVHCQR